MAYTWTDPAALAAALGPSITLDAVWAQTCCDAANRWAPRKRAEAGYVDPVDPADPGADVRLGTTLYAVALYRERGAVDGYPSFEELSSFAQTGGSSGQIRRLLGIGRGRVDRAPTDTEVVAARRRRRRLAVR